MPSPSDSSTTASDAALPPQSVRTAVSFLLFAYLFVLAAGVASRGGFESPLELALGNVQGLRHLRQLLWMDDSYDVYLTHAEEQDVDHTISAEVTMPDGSTESVDFPGATRRTPDGRRHWQNLANRLGVYSAVPDLEAARDIATQGIAEHVLGQTGAKSVVIRVRGHLTPSRIEEYNPDDPTAWTRYRDVYAARAWISGGRVNLLKIESAVDTAPAARPAKQ